MSNLTLANVIHRLLVNGALLVSGTIVSSIIAGTSGKASSKVAIGKLAGSITASELDDIMNRLCDENYTRQKDDLQRAVGLAIAVTIQAFAENNQNNKDKNLLYEFPAYKGAIHKLARNCGEYWHFLDIPKYLECQATSEIDKYQVTELFSTDASDFNKVTALDIDAWQIFVEELREKSKIFIPNYIIVNISFALHTAFPKALRELLKNDFEKGGFNFAPLYISLLGIITEPSINFFIKINTSQLKHFEYDEYLGRDKLIVQKTWEKFLLLKKNRDRNIRKQLLSYWDESVRDIADKNLRKIELENPEEISYEISQIEQQLYFLYQQSSNKSEAANTFRNLALDVNSSFQEALQQINLEGLQFNNLLDGVAPIYQSQELHNLAVVLNKIDSQPIQTTSSSFIDTNLPCLKYWQGRTNELEQLRDWLKDKSINLIFIQGIGGIGKSTLASKIYTEASEYFDNKFWAGVSQKPSFSEFAKQVLIQLERNSNVQVYDANASQLVYELRNCLQSNKFLLVIDNFETLLKAEGQLQDKYYQEFLNVLRKCKSGSKVVITTRQRLAEFEENSCWLPLLGFSPEEGSALLRCLGILDSEEQLQKFSQQAEGHPLLLNLLAKFFIKQGLIHHIETPKLDVSDLLKLLSDPENAKTYVSKAVIIQNLSELEDKFNHLSPKQQRLLLNLSVYSSGFNLVDAGAILSQEVFKQDLDELEKAGFLTKQTNTSEKWKFKKPFIWTYIQLKAGEQPDIHELAIKYYKSSAKLPNSWETLDDLKEYLEIFEHRFQKKEYSLAFEVINKFDSFLDTQGYNTKRAELYQKLVQTWEPCQKEDKNKFMLSFYALANAYSSLGEYQAAIKSYKSALDIAREIGDRFQETRALNDLAGVYICLAKYHLAIDYHQQCLYTFQELGDSIGEASALCYLGSAYCCLGKFNTAIEYNKMSLEITERERDTLGKANALNNLGNVYNYLGEKQLSFNYYNESLLLARREKNIPKEVTYINNLGCIYNNLGNYKEAIGYNKKALELAQRIGDRWEEANSLNNLGNTFAAIKRYDESIKKQEESCNIAREINAPHLEANALSSLGSIFYIKKEYHKAIEHYEESLKIKEKICDSFGEAKQLHNLATVYLQTGNLKKGLTLQKQAKQILQEYQIPLHLLGSLWQVVQDRFI
ncbi:tetratricopeptide repeat protein [Calothrix membranacea FACHB-236]|nr:tetratricopeptide repeat protein [Calothrix membranacea FACHB-236]